MSHYVTTGDAARELGINPATLTRWVKAGTVTPAEITEGGHYRWDMRSLRAQVRRNELSKLPTTVEEIARVLMAANREVQIDQGDPAPSPPWDEAPEYQREQTMKSVRKALADPGRTPEQNHEGWLEEMRADGFVYGPAKDPEAKTHPAMLPWDQLPAKQKLKDYLFIAIVRAMAMTRDVEEA